MPSQGGGGACECPINFFAHYKILRVYTVLHNNTWITKLITDYLSAERKGGLGVTYMAVSVARACK